MDKINLLPLPNNWIWCSLNEILNKIESGSKPGGGVNHYSNGVPSIGAEHLNDNGGFNFHNLRFIPEIFYNNMHKGKIQPYDILIVKDGSTTGKVSYVNQQFPYSRAAINEHIFLIRGNNQRIDQEYLFYYLFSGQGHHQIKKKFKGSAQGGINSGFISDFPIPIPPLQEQRRIVLEIRLLTTKLRQLSQSLHNLPFMIKKIRQGILASAFTGNLSLNFSDDINSLPLLEKIKNERKKKWLEIYSQKKFYEEPIDYREDYVPKLTNRWIYTSIDFISYKLENGKTPLRSDPSNFDKNGIPLIKVENIQKNGIVTLVEDQLRISNHANKKQTKSQIDSGDVLVNIVGPPLGKVGFVPTELNSANINQAIVLIRTVNSYSSKLLMYCLLSPFYQNYMYKLARGDRQLNIRKSDIGRIPIPLIPELEQKYILKQIEKSFFNLLQFENLIKEVRKKCEYINEVIFFKAFTGKLVIQNPEESSIETLVK